jgi:hypothetical protein
MEKYNSPSLSFSLLFISSLIFPGNFSHLPFRINSVAMKAFLLSTPQETKKFQISSRQAINSLKDNCPFL